MNARQSAGIDVCEIHGDMNALEFGGFTWISVQQKYFDVGTDVAFQTFKNSFSSSGNCR